MRASLAIIPLGAAIAMAAVVADENGWYIRRAEDMHLEDLPIVDLEVTDERFEGMKLTGTAESIYHEMKGLKPELFENETALETGTTLDKRQSLNCGWYNGINDRVNNWFSCIEGLTYLMNLGTSWCGVSAAPAFARISCSRGCGIFLCNKLGHHLQVHCGDIPNDVNAIGNNCMDSVGRFSGARDFSSHFIGVRKQSC
ncbi:hypothetical protein B0T11DRAFT_300960 [Plectosphaerella cucumerina]|uniref:C2H2-type domain-containing protein n=1 Tax=Plectosphaerella cucumerina TaxID=40658 RepID=A0A8K0T8J5_9PEZI|nr:hypothetical protein B0T11DRAFT_300960 [Plectosphaerella cucumerina]